MSRQLARETAFQMIFQMDVGDNPLEMAELTMDEALMEEKISKKECSYIMEVVKGVAEKKAECDAFITAHTKGWTIDRINRVEKNIIRLAWYEINYMPDIPFEVAVNEGIELAKKYGDDDAYSFVNGILDRARPAKKEGETL